MYIAFKNHIVTNHAIITAHAYKNIVLHFTKVGVGTNNAF